ncbi:amino acid transporter [Methanocella sp. CWC-04]|uniref:Amino acid transporter n=1 Tax=Methanooceanicella nereidis TaxID=2052831 RepID=A0AAP2W6Z5_9EURY|nr:amino acid permease [Methanocella sp. CWC-04]MCD1295827.1 amino acid transporter [Methanocella sp. CWC-04]
MKLSRNLTFFSVLAMGFADVGADIFIAIGIIAAFAAGLTPVAFFIGAILYVCTALAYAELGSAFPVAGGASTFTRKAFGKFWSFVSGWGLILAYILDIALFTIVGSFYLNQVLHLDIQYVYFIAAGVIVLLIILNLLGIAESAFLNNILTVFATFLIIVISILAYMLLFNTDRLISQALEFQQQSTWTNFAYAIGLSSIAFIGIESITQAAEETKRPSHTIPKAIKVVIILVVTFCLLLSVLSVGSVGWETLSENKENALVAFAKEIPVYGETLVLITGITGFLVCVVSANTGIIGASRVMYSLSKHNLLPKILSWTHPKYKTPWFTVIIFPALAIPLIFVKVEILSGIYAFGALIAYILINLSFIALKNADFDSMFRVPFVFDINFRKKHYKVPLTGLIGFVACAFSLCAVILPQRITLIVGVSWIAIGMLIYVINTRFANKEIHRIPEKEVLAVSKIDEREPTILMSFKLMPHERHIIDIATNLAKEYKCSVTILNIVETPTLVPLWEDLPEEMVLQKKKEIETFEEWFKGSGIDVHVEFKAAREAASGIIRYIETHNVKVVILGKLEGKPSPTVDEIRKNIDVPILIVRNAFSGKIESQQAA